MLYLSTILSTVCLFLYLENGRCTKRVHRGIWSLSRELSKEVDKTQLLEPVELRFVNHTDPIVAKAGETIELQCSAFGVPQPIFFWLRDGKRVGGSGETLIYEKLRNVGRGSLQSGITVTTLRIPCIDASKAATYTCIAVNGYKKIQKTIKVDVEGDAVECPKGERPAPYVTEFTESRFENMGNSAQLLCRHTDPQAAVIWFDKNMEKINNNPAYEISIEACINPSPAGSESDKLRPIRTLLQSSCFSLLLFHPELIIYFSLQTVNNVLVMPNGDLMIRNSDFDRDTGVFTCVVANEAGESRAETFFYAAAPEDEEEAKKKRR